MDDMTLLDAAFEAMMEAGEEGASRLRFHERLADAQLFLMLTEEAQGENISPELFELADGRFILVFDTEERLSRFAGRPVPYAALSGRVIVQMLAGQGIGLGLNLDVAPSSTLIPAEAVEWLGETLAHVPEEVESGISEFTRPKGLPDALLSALDLKLAVAGGLASCAYLVGVRYDSGGAGHLLGFVDAQERAKAALAKAAGEALTFSGIDAGMMDVGFFESSNPAAAKLAAVGMRYDLPAPPEPEPYQPVIPGSDPNKPPKLR
ncbi:MAG: SseB family protein [Rhodobacteraceae bacterium]|nr:SseB family protein [Paracoccaceae bacterium]